MLISSHVALSCKDPRVSERFYTRYFGFQRARVIPLDGDQIIFIKSGDTYLELFKSNGESHLPPFQNDGPTYPGLRHIAFQVEDVDRKLADISTDAHITLGPLDFRLYSRLAPSLLEDPDGNIVKFQLRRSGKSASAG
jgi:glyoxylase I family protein